MVVAAGPKLEYWDFTGAGKDEAWQWEADLGDNFNGWRFSTQTFVGYRMPRRVEMVGVLVSTVTNLFWNAKRSPMDEPGGWGSDFVTVTIAPLVNVTLSDNAPASRRCCSSGPSATTPTPPSATATSSTGTTTAGSST